MQDKSRHREIFGNQLRKTSHFFIYLKTSAVVKLRWLHEQSYDKDLYYNYGRASLPNTPISLAKFPRF